MKAIFREPSGRLAVSASMRVSTALSFAFVVCAAPSVSAAQCVLEGVTRLRSLRQAPATAMPIEQHMRVTLLGRTATVEGLLPIAFRTEISASLVDLYISDAGLRTAVVGASRGVHVTVESTTRDVVVATLTTDGALTVRGVHIPCRSLSTAPVRTALQYARAPEYPSNPRWISDATANYGQRCTTRRGMTECSISRNRCNPVGDASVCGYHPRASTLRMFAAPNDQSESVEISATADVSLADEDGRPGWLRVVSRALAPDALVVRGWVRRGAVRWTQEVPPSAMLGLGNMGVIGVARLNTTRYGFVIVSRDTDITAERDDVWGRVAAEWCTSGELPQGSSRVSVALPGEHRNSAAFVASDRVRWVPECPQHAR